MLLNPWLKATILQERLTEANNAILRHMKCNQFLSSDNRMLHHELSYAHAALRRKNIQLKQFKASLEIHKEYVRLHAPETTR
jgi:hypothetical protein